MIILASIVLAWILCSLISLVFAFIEHKMNPSKIYSRDDISAISIVILAGPFGLALFLLVSLNDLIQKLLMKLFY